MSSRPLYRRIAVGVDFSAPSREALRRAAELARVVGARLDVVHVVRKVRPAIPFSKQNRVAAAGLLRAEVEEARARLERWRPKGDDLDVTVRVTTGTPAAGLLRHAERIGADLIVVSNVGHGSLHDVLIGSTAERVVQQATVPVLMVPAPSARRGARS